MKICGMLRVDFMAPYLINIEYAAWKHIKIFIQLGDKKKAEIAKQKRRNIT